MGYCSAYYLILFGFVERWGRAAFLGLERFRLNRYFEMHESYMEEFFLAGGVRQGWG